MSRKRGRAAVGPTGQAHGSQSLDRPSVGKTDGADGVTIHASG